MLDLRQAAVPYHLFLGSVPEALQPAAVATWRGRMVNESSSASVFEGLAAQLAALGCDEAASRCRTFAAEERHHGVLCAAVVASLGGEPVAPERPAADYPLHPDIEPLEAVVRNLLHICCLSETIAVALIGAEREEMPEGPLRNLLTSIWADECGHANFGWRLLPQLLARDPQLAGRLGPWLHVAIADVEAHELAHLPDGGTPDAAGRALGLCSGAMARGLLYATLEKVILPALATHGLAPDGLSA